MITLRAASSALFALCGAVACSLAMDLSKLDEGCPEGTKPCDGRCVSKLLPGYGCGNSSCAPCVLDHAKSNCNLEFECSIAACAPRYDNCDEKASTGCETNLYETKTHCGSCGIDCTTQNVLNASDIECGGAACYVKTCNTGWFDCNGVFPDGCEVPAAQLAIDNSNCGNCRVKCGAGQSCVDGTCQ
jgi:hypothetical protein